MLDSYRVYGMAVPLIGTKQFFIWYVCIYNRKNIYLNFLLYNNNKKIRIMVINGHLQYFFTKNKLKM